MSQVCATQWRRIWMRANLKWGWCAYCCKILISYQIHCHWGRATIMRRGELWGVWPLTWLLGWLCTPPGQPRDSRGESCRDWLRRSHMALPSSLGWPSVNYWRPNSKGARSVKHGRLSFGQLVEFARYVIMIILYIRMDSTVPINNNIIEVDPKYSS